MLLHLNCLITLEWRCNTGRLYYFAWLYQRLFALFDLRVRFVMEGDVYVVDNQRLDKSLEISTLLLLSVTTLLYIVLFHFSDGYSINRDTVMKVLELALFYSDHIIAQSTG